MKIAEVVSTMGTQHIGFSMDTALNYLDTQMPEGIMGVPIKLIADVIAGLGGIAGGLYLPWPWDTLVPLLGGYISTDLWRYISAAVPAGLPLATPPTLVYTPPATTPTPAAQGRYTVKPQTPTKGARYQIVV